MSVSIFVRLVRLSLSLSLLFVCLTNCLSSVCPSVGLSVRPSVGRSVGRSLFLSSLALEGFVYGGGELSTTFGFEGDTGPQLVISPQMSRKSCS